MSSKFILIYILYNLLIINQLQAQLVFDFDYKNYVQSADFQFKIDSSTYQKSVKIDWISFVSPAGVRVKGFCVQLSASNPTSAVLLFQHEGRQSKEQFLSEAMLWAQSGGVAWAIDAPNLCEAPHDFNRSEVAYVYREGIKHWLLLIEWLKNQGKAQKIGFVGHSFGANLGAILAAQTTDIQAFVLVACPNDLPEFYQQMNEAGIQKIKEQTAKERLDIWLSLLIPLEAQHYLPRARMPIFFQFAEDDEYISPQSALQLFKIAPQPKEMKYYWGGHALNREAEQDRWNWLMDKLMK
ncbi:MAG: hypothetical protein MUE85_20870 [Microscillaceae bacterium]|jgi:pimeloyl-ACP methyl ester carboxylesterase|nr:hypothetical protein [Microscillaceae bacterium]